MWQDQAACKDHNALFMRMFTPPPRGSPSREWQALAKAAKDICATCPVIEPCRTLHKSEVLGVWGGVYRNRQRDFAREIAAKRQKRHDARIKAANLKQSDEHLPGLPS